MTVIVVVVVVVVVKAAAAFGLLVERRTSVSQILGSIPSQVAAV